MNKNELPLKILDVVVFSILDYGQEYLFEKET
jgi:hypothetical protein